MSSKKYFPLTHAEKRIYLTQKLHPNSCMWNVPVSLRMTMVDMEQLHKALELVIQNTLGLQLIFTEQDGSCCKYLADNFTPVIEVLDYSEKGEQKFLEWANKQANMQVPMLDAQPYRLGIADVGAKTCYIYTNYHHILADGGSSDLIFRRVIEVYEALQLGKPVHFPEKSPLETAYQAEQEYISSDQYEKDKLYWNNLFETIPEPMDIAGKPIPKSLNQEKYDRKFNSKTSELLLKFCGENKVSPFRVVLAAMGLVLSRTLRRNDLVFGTATANRYPKELQESMGMFVNTCAMRLGVDKEDTFTELIQSASQSVRNTLAHGRYPYDSLMADIRNRTGETPDLVSCTLVEMVRSPYPDNAEAVLQYHSQSLISLAGFLTYPHSNNPDDTQVKLDFVYNKDLYEPWQIEQLLRHIEQAISVGVASPDIRVKDIDFLTDSERNRLVYDFNETAANWDLETTLHQSISAISKRFPARTAVFYRGKSLTYAELDVKSNAVARTLQENGASPGKVVGLLAERSVEIIIAQLAILKCGCAFMPVDAGYPDSRIQFMLEDIDAPLILTQTRFIQEREFGSAHILNLDDASTFHEDDSAVSFQLHSPDDLCVVIYTSGSTGAPKGVMLEHRSICNTINATIHDHEITPEDNISKHASFSFDASLLEVFSALMSGATLHIIPEEIRLSLSHLNEYYETHGITWSFLTTQLGEQFMDFMDNKSLRVLAIGGEKMRIYKPRNYRLLNLYGPTECSIYATQLTVEGIEDNIPIGHPLPNFRIYILDEHDHPQPPGYGGELCIAGPGVARCYHNRDENNASCFVPDPFHVGETMYRTGDLACWRPDGVILHLGRIDRQVKLRGFRIELGEIENAMLSVKGVNEAAVADFKDNNGHVYLCGYISGDVEPTKVLAALDGKIPPFMIPAHMLELDSLPVNPSGKIDRKKLPEPKSSVNLEQEYISPETDQEKALCNIWAEVLDRERVSVEADFFQSGGDSLRAVALQVVIGQQLEHDIELAAIFENPSPRQMAVHIQSGDSGNRIEQAAMAETYPTTVSQQQLFLLNRMKGIGTAYNMPLCIALRGKLNHKKLSDALLRLLDRHEALRTAFEIHDGQCVQRVLNKVHLKLDFAQTTSDDPQEIARGFAKPFDLTTPPLMQAKLFARSKELHWLLIDFHHITFDGVSVGIYLRELFALYSGEQLEPLTIQHKDVASWEKENEARIKEKHQSFWHTLFESPPEAEMPTDFMRPGHQDFAGAVYRHQLDSDLTTALRDLAKEHGATLHQIFMAAIGILVSRWSDTEDVCLGNSMSGRDLPGTSHIIGMFVRTLPTRIKPKADKRFVDLLREIKKQMQEIHEHGGYPISSLYEHLGVNRGPGRHPMFDINFVMRNVGTEELYSVDGLQAEVIALPTNTAKFDISIAVEEDQGKLIVELDYRTSLYRRETIARLTGHLSTILGAFTKAPDSPVGILDVLKPEEQDTLLYHFNPRPTPAPEWKTVCQAIEKQAQIRPDHIAVKAENGILTYGELNSLANRVARAIVNSGGGRDQIVAVVADRSTWPVVGMLAALKSGSGYVGLDTNYPEERVGFILEDTEAPCVVGTNEQLRDLSLSCAAIEIDSDLPDDDTDLGVAEGGDALAYCIFTSGSTGTPKGVLIEHQAMVNFIDWYATHHCMTPQSGCAAFAAFSFDVSVVQVFAPLVSGATLHIIGEDMRRSPHDLDDYFTANQITNAHFPTQFAEQFMRMCKMDSLKYLVVGGDSLKSYELGSYRLTNEYGPSETAMACLSYDVSEVMTKPPIGSPVANTRIYILDAQKRLCPLGVPGEICVAGVQVGRGYLNRKELTDKHFVEDPFFPGQKMFRTGDKGKWLDDGTVDFIGRMDFQVKIRGYRIEPGEIEEKVKSIASVLEAVVVPIDEPHGNKALAAYFTAEIELDSVDVKNTLKEVLPEYMIPTHFVQLEKMPLNPNGKVDRKKLPRPEVTPAATGPLTPRNPKETLIAGAWERVLGHKGFGLFDSFYDIGGDSLNAIALLADLSETFDISASDLFAHTTIADQANHFNEAETGRSTRLLSLKKLADKPADDPSFAQEVDEYKQSSEGDAILDTETLQSFKHVLITGATGTLGIYLLRELLQNSKAHITAIVRAKDDKAAYERLDVHYQDRFGRSLQDEQADRLDVLTGDLAVSGFGMDETVYQRLEQSVDTILNSAALTSHYGDWDVFVAANITSVENLADFARKGVAGDTDNLKTLHHISTTSIGSGKIENRTQALFTEFDVDMGQKPGNLYVRSKLESEIMLEKMRAEGLPVSVYRAGNVACDSETGVFQRNIEDNAFYQQIRAYVNLGVAPDFTDVRNISYVDQSAKAIVTLMGRPGLVGQTFHIQNPHLLSLSDALSSESLGLCLKQLPFNDFIEFFAQHAGCLGFDEYIERILLHMGWQDWLSKPDITGTATRAERTVSLLKRCGFTWKVPVPEDLRLFVKQALQDRADKLATIPGFSSLSEEDRKSVARCIKPEFFGEAKLLQQENEPVDGVRLVIEGFVETYRHNINGWVGTVRISGSGACMGEEAVLEDSNAINSVEALDDTFVFQLGLDEIRKLNKQHPQLGFALLKLANLKTDQAERLFVAI